MRKLRLLSISAVVAGLVLAMGALSLDGRGAEAAPEDDVEALVQAAADAWNAQDAELFVTYFTDEGLESNFGLTRDDVAALEEEMAGTGPITSASVTDLFLTSGQGTGIVEIQFEVGFVLFEEWEFLFEDGGWKIGVAEPASRPIPEGVPAVDLFLDEYSFTFNEAAIQAADGNFAFNAFNVGDEAHEVVLFSLDTDDSLGDVVQSLLEAGPEEEVPGITFEAFGGEFDPGAEGTVVWPAPLSPGRYGLVCFFPAPDGTPHVALGMIEDFVIGSQAGGGATPISPPSTGDAGLLTDASSTASWLLLGLALTLVAGGTYGLVRSRKASDA